MHQASRINDVLAFLTPEEIRDALWMVSVWQRWDLPAAEAAEWRRRILAHAEYVSVERTAHEVQ